MHKREKQQTNATPSADLFWQQKSKCNNYKTFIFFQCVVWATLTANNLNQRKLVPLSGNLNGLFKGALLRLEEFLVIGSELDELPHGVTGPEIHCSWTPWLCRRYEAHCRHQRSGWCSWTWLCGVPRPPSAGSSSLWNTARHRINNKNKTALTALVIVR